MSVLAGMATFALIPLLATALWNLWRAPRLHAYRAVATGPRVSVLVPARNEAFNLRACLPALLASRYDDLEILVLDDESSDATRLVAQHAAAESAGRLRVLVSDPRPDGWTGKNWACHQLARHATGQVLLFCDADVIARPFAIGRTVRALHESGAGLVTGLPSQRLDSMAAAAVVPLVMHVTIAAGLPLEQVARTRSPSLVLGNGQWMAFDADEYRRIGGHPAVRDRIVEDMALARRVKEAGGVVLPVIATRDLEVRMYGNLADLREGFRKNLYPLAGARLHTALPLLALLLLTMALPLLVPLNAAFWMLLAVRVTSAAIFRHGWLSILLHPVGIALLVWIGIESAIRFRDGRLTWKNRPLRSTA
jgi:chlorobactene glucosyltransferase